MNYILQVNQQQNLIYLKSDYSMNKVPDFVTLSTPEEYKKYYTNKYCKNGLQTFDGIKVKFYEDQFEHAFYESSNKLKRNKDIFSVDRALRIDWIEYVLKNPNAELHLGWDRDKKKYNKDRRVAIISPEDYVVIIRINNNNTTAKFITAYYADNSASEIRKMPLWT